MRDKSFQQMKIHLSEQLKYPKAKLEPQTKSHTS